MGTALVHTYASTAYGSRWGHLQHGAGFLVADEVLLDEIPPDLAATPYRDVGQLPGTNRAVVQPDVENQFGAVLDTLEEVPQVVARLLAVTKFADLFVNPTTVRLGELLNGLSCQTTALRNMLSNSLHCCVPTWSARPASSTTLQIFLPSSAVNANGFSQ